MAFSFSIITCTWNSKAFIANTIKSVLTQDYSDVEYIFVDGGSTDGTLEEIAAIQRPVTLLHDVNGGIANAMNAGIDAATGDVIAHIHSDDYYLANDVLSRVAMVFERENRGWAFGRSLSDIDGELVPEAYTPPIYSYSAMLKRNFVPHAATFVKRSVFQKVGHFNENFRLAMDYEMWLRIGKRFEPSIIPTSLAAFRRHPNSATQTNQLASLNEDFKARFMHAPIYRYPEFALHYFKRRSQLIRRLGRERVGSA